MSVKLMNLAWTVAIPNASAKIVLLALADHANDEGTSCFPQIETICKKCGLTYRGVTKILEQLKTNGQITVVSGRGRHRSNNYKVHPDPTRKWEPRSYFKHGENRNETTRKWERGDTKIGTDEQENRNDVPTYPSVPIIEPSITTNGTAPIESASAYSHSTEGEEDDETLAILRRLSPPSVKSAPTTTSPPEPQEDEHEDDDELPLLNVSSEKKKKTGAQKEKGWQPDEYQKVINRWFKRRDWTAWSAKELKAYRAIDEQTIIDGIEDLNAYYSASKEVAPYKRREILTLLNNWSGDMDKWAEWSAPSAQAELMRRGLGNKCRPM